MSSSPSNWGEFLDVRRIRRLAELMNDQGLAEIDLRLGDSRIRLCRAVETGSIRVEPRSAAALPEAAAPPPAAAPSPAVNMHEIKSPMVGTYYASSSPDSPPYVKVGDHVSHDTTVCLVEAMKVFNEIPAEISGKIVSVLVENGEPVEFGQPLFRVDTNG